MNRTYPDPKVRQLERDRSLARMELASAQRRHKELLTSREMQQADEERFRREGLEPYLYPRNPGPENEHERTVNGLQTVYRWASDDEIADAAKTEAAAAKHLAKVEADFEKALANETRLVEAEQLAAAKKVDGYLITRDSLLAGQWYAAGQVVAPDALKDVDWPQLSLMLGGRMPLLRKA